MTFHFFFGKHHGKSLRAKKKNNRPNQAKSLNRWRNSRLCSVSRPFNLGSRSARDVVHLYASNIRVKNTIYTKIIQVSTVFRVSFTE